MRPGLDLKGVLFGQLRVTGTRGSVTYGGRVQTAWEVVCACGALEVYPQSQLVSGRVLACANCRRPPCRICGSPIPPSRPRASTCSENCHQQARRTIHKESYHRRAEDPGFNSARWERQREREAVYPELRDRRLERGREANRRYRDQPGTREALAAYYRDYYGQNRGEILRQRKERLDRMDPEALEQWREAMRGYGRAYRKRWREELKSDPDRHRQYLDLQAEYRRRKK